MQEITFEQLPETLIQILEELKSLRCDIGKLGKGSINPTPRHPIGIDEVCAILGKAKPTVYALACKRLIPCYKSGKKLYFYEDEILAWIEQGRRSTMDEIKAKALKRE